MAKIFGGWLLDSNAGYNATGRNRIELSHGFAMSRLLLRDRWLTVELSGDLNARSIDALLAESPELGSNATGIVVNMSQVSMAKPAGACFLLCLLARLVECRRDCVVPIEFIPPARAVSSFLCTLGFFSALSKKAMLVGCDDLLAEDTNRRTRRVESNRSRPPGAARDASISRTVVLPMEFLPASAKTVRAGAFDNLCATFVNSIADKFEHLLQSGHISGMNNGQGFWNANLELFKNVFDHSESWGIASIMASPRLGLTVTFHDLGIGIPATVRRSPPQNSALIRMRRRFAGL